MKFFYCCSYVFISGMLFFFLGRVIPYRIINESFFLFRCFSFEKQGMIYRKIKIDKWQKKLPDMSRIFKRIMPSKSIETISAENMKVLIKETCIAEFSHYLLGISAFFCKWFWCSRIYRILLCFYEAGNAAFIIIQRYNRPRLQRVVCKLENKFEIRTETEVLCNENINIEL